MNDNYLDGDIVFIMGNERYSYFYFDHIINYRIWSGSTLKRDNKNIFTGIEEISNIEEIDDIISLKERVWIITSYSIYSGYEKAPRIFHINYKLRVWLRNQEKYLVYTSEDDSARVYLIKILSLPTLSLYLSFSFRLF